VNIVPAKLRESSAKHIAPILVAATPSRRLSKYRSEALRREAATVASTSKGGRNDTLNKASFSIGTLIGSSEVDQAEAETTLMTAARGCGLPDGKARRTLASRINSKIEHPRQHLASGAAATRREHGAEGERSAR